MNILFKLQTLVALIGFCAAALRIWKRYSELWKGGGDTYDSVFASSFALDHAGCCHDTKDGWTL